MAGINDSLCLSDIKLSGTTVVKVKAGTEDEILPMVLGMPGMALRGLGGSFSILHAIYEITRHAGL